MKVLLKRNFIIEGHRYRRDARGTTIRDEHCDRLPSDAKILGDDYASEGDIRKKLNEAEKEQADKAKKAKAKPKPMALSELAKKNDPKNVDVDL